MSTLEALKLMHSLMANGCGELARLPFTWREAFDEAEAAIVEAEKQEGSRTPDPKPKEPIDRLLEWMDNAVAYMEKQLRSDEEVRTSDSLSAHYAGMISGYRIARTKAREIQNSTIS